MNEPTLKDAYCRWNDTEIAVGNDLIERRFDLADGMLRTVSLKDKALDREWVQTDRQRFTFRLPGMADEETFSAVAFDCDVADNAGMSAESLRLTIRMTFAACTVATTLRVYPNVPVIAMNHQVQGTPGATDLAHSPVWDLAGSRKEVGPIMWGPYPHPDTIDSLPIEKRHLRARAVRLLDVTDSFDTLVREERTVLYDHGYEKLGGNLLFVDDAVDPAGFFIVKESPCEFGHLGYPGFDFQTGGRNTIDVRGAGLRAEELEPDRFRATYGAAVGVFDPASEDGDEALRRFYDAEDLFVPERDTYMLANTWGGRSKDLKISDAFMRAEVDRAAELGIDVCQLDYGWAIGQLAGIMKMENARLRAQGEDYWAPHPERFPQGLGPLCEYAAERGVAIGLWFVADSFGDYAEWEKDRDVLVDLYRTHGIRHFKIDSIEIGSKTDEERVIAFLESVERASDNNIAFQIDLTNGRRTGYAMLKHIGEIFVENRYTDWGNYYPHQTLRNLWTLSKYVPSRRLQMEFLDNRRCTEKYPDEPLAPANWPIDYTFATTMVGAPLVWLEPSELSDEQCAALSPVMAAYRAHRNRMLACDVFPIGEEPCGTSWTGFQAHNAEGGYGYLAVYREFNDRPDATFTLRHIASRDLKLEIVAGGGFVSDGRVDAGGSLTVSLADARSYALVRYEL